MQNEPTQRRRKLCSTIATTGKHRAENADQHAGDEAWPPPDLAHQKRRRHRAAGSADDESGYRQRGERLVVAEHVIGGNRGDREGDRTAPRRRSAPASGEDEDVPARLAVVGERGHQPRQPSVISLPRLGPCTNARLDRLSGRLRTARSSISWPSTSPPIRVTGPPALAAAPRTPALCPAGPRQESRSPRRRSGAAPRASASPDPARPGASGTLSASITRRAAGSCAELVAIADQPVGHIHRGGGEFARAPAPARRAAPARGSAGPARHAPIRRGFDHGPVFPVRSASPTRAAPDRAGDVELVARPAARTPHHPPLRHQAEGGDGDDRPVGHRDRVAAEERDRETVPGPSRRPSAKAASQSLVDLRRQAEAQNIAERPSRPWRQDRKGSPAAPFWAIVSGGSSRGNARSRRPCRW